MRYLLLFLVLAGLLAADPAVVGAPANWREYYANEDFYEYLTVFRTAFAIIRRDAVTLVGGERLVRAAIAGMLATLDPRAVYLDEAQVASEGRAVDTMGLAVTRRRGAFEVVAPRDGSPAARSGLAPRDILLRIGREPTASMSLSEVEERLQGAAGSVVRLRLRRRGLSHPLTVAVTRARFRLRSVRSRRLGEIGYVRLAGFEAGTPAALQAAMSQLRERGAGSLVGIILDLRDNPGGKFEAAVAVAGAFLDGQVIALIRGRGPGATPLPAPPGDLAAGLPVVALINGGTAAEAELVAGALKGDRRAVLVGTRSFGENAIETTIPLAAGGAIRLATARFLTPAGQDIHEKGIVPNITVKLVRLVPLGEGRRIRDVTLSGARMEPDCPMQGRALVGLQPAAALAAGESRGDEQLKRAADILRALAVSRGEGG